MTARVFRVIARCRRATFPAWLLGVLTGPAMALEAEAPTDLLSQAWYYTEVVVFQRPLVLDHANDEALVRAPAPLPAHLRWLGSAATPGTGPGLPSADYELDPGTHAYLAFPYLDRSLLPDGVVDSDGFSDQDARYGDARYGDARYRDARYRDARSRDDGAAEGALPDEGLEADPLRRPVPTIEPRLAPDPLLDFLRELAAFETSLKAASYRWLSPETFTLNPERSRLERRGGYRILLHGRWLQPVPARDAPEPLLFRTGPKVGAGHALEGAFDVTLGRFLHFNARLYYTEPLLGRRPLDRPQGGPDSAASAPALVFDPAGVMQLRESRRLRSDELHYLDHPKLGVLVRMTPAEPPEALSADFAALTAEGAEEGAQ